MQNVDTMIKNKIKEESIREPNRNHIQLLVTEKNSGSGLGETRAYFSLTCYSRGMKFRAI